MSFNWSTLATLGVLTATVHWIVARAKITKPFWDAAWLPKFVDDALVCPACSGFWLGLAAGAAGIRPLATGSWWIDVPVAGVCGVFMTPLFEGLILWGLDRSKVA
jgi:hypothetical protein